MEIAPAWLAPTWFIDCDAPEVGAFAEEAIGDATDRTEQAVRLFEAVRDGIRYDPYNTSREPGAYRASAIAATEANWCVPKAVLFAAAARRVGIPARLGFADVTNHLTSAKLADRMKTDVFAWHGYTELLLGDRWFKLSTAFNKSLCERFGLKTLDFDGTADALMHPYDVAGNRHMEYIRQRGSFDDLPLEQIFATFDEIYPRDIMEAETGKGAAAAGDDAFAE